MAGIKIIRDAPGRTLTVWFDEPTLEHTCVETTEEVVLMKDSNSRVIGLELPHYDPATPARSLDVETIMHTQP